MNIQIIAVGKLKERYLLQGIDEYAKRLSAYAKLDIVEVAEEQARDPVSEAEADLIKDKEGERILKRIHPDSYVIALAINGKPMSSEQLAAHLDRLGTYGTSRITFLIGGSYGLSEKVLCRADLLLSFSKMTFPHQLMRLILLEQIYRAFKINRGETYHK
jgi:23S rRNA (pseudouridine1915-N3)-methyltransferase